MLPASFEKADLYFLSKSAAEREGGDVSERSGLPRAASANPTGKKVGDPAGLFSPFIKHTGHGQGGSPHGGRS